MQLVSALNEKIKPKSMCSGWLLTSAWAPLRTWMLPYSSNACKTFSIFPGTINYSVGYAKPYQAVSTLVHCLQVCNLTRVYFRQQCNIIFSKTSRFLAMFTNFEVFYSLTCEVSSYFLTVDNTT